MPKIIVFEVKGARVVRIRIDSEVYRKPRLTGFGELIQWLTVNNYDETRQPVKAGSVTRHYYRKSIMGTIVLSESERGVRSYGA